VYDRSLKWYNIAILNGNNFLSVRGY